ncbi:MAG TPA: thioredoxin [Candidatus Saccharimonadales bacterium]|nr:thioredoxin [Candidatus Saccharimonadales bacterium]
MADTIFSDANFDAEVHKSTLPVLVDFWAPWCGPCRAVSPIVEELGKEFEGKLKVGKLNVDDNQQSSSQYGVMSIPTLMIFKNGKPVKTMIGAQSKENIKKGIEEALAS